jgi:N12 class adenine-specific DNA methylase
VLERTGGRNIVFATGTPISNTMAEMFTMQRYLDGKALKDLGVPLRRLGARCSARS